MAASRDDIVTAAIHHLNAVPTASMAELAEAAGVSRATLHRHFSSRDELLVALGHRALESWAQVHETVGLAETLRLDAPGTARLRQTLDDLLVGLLDSADEHRFALTDHAMAVVPELLSRANELEEREIELLAAAQRAGILRAGLPVRWLSNTVFGLLVAARESLQRGDVARRDLPGILLETFYRGTT